MPRSWQQLDGRRRVPGRVDPHPNSGPAQYWQATFGGGHLGPDSGSCRVEGEDLHHGDLLRVGDHHDQRAHWAVPDRDGRHSGQAVACRHWQVGSRSRMGRERD